MSDRQMEQHQISGTVLDQIVDRTLRDLAVRQESVPLSELQHQVGIAHRKPIPLRQALEQTRLSVISEVKRASPSRGVFPVEINAAELAQEYIAGGTDAISVLTDNPFFRGSVEDLNQVAEVAHAAKRPVPILRKDFILSEYQVWQSAMIGADALLLIVAVLRQHQLKRLQELATDLGLSTLVEVHDEAEMERAILAGADLIGINNRDLRNFDVNLATTERLAALAPAGTLLVSESGVFDVADCQRLVDAGARAVLVGEGLILSNDRSGLIRSFSSVPIPVAP